MKSLKKSFWFFLIALQAFLGIGAGALFLSTLKVDVLASKAHVGDMALQGNSADDIERQLTSYFNKKIEQAVIHLKVDGAVVDIPYKDIEVTLDAKKTMEALFKVAPQNGLKALFSGDDAIRIDPVLTYNSGILVDRLQATLEGYETQAVQESYEVEGDKLKCNPAVEGRKVNYSYIEQLINASMSSFSETPIALNATDSSLYEATKAQSLSGGPYTTLIAQSVIPIPAELKSQAEAFINGINGSVTEDGQGFSLASRVDFSKAVSDVQKDLLNRVASAVYQALLPIEGIKITNRLPSEQSVSYTETGLEAVIRGEKGDLAMQNNTGKPIMLLAELKDKAIHVYAISSGELKSGIMIVQKKDQVPPPVITSVNTTLSKNDSRVVSEGIPGFTAYVSRIIDNDRIELYHTEYKPVSKIVETGDSSLHAGSK
ncbi:MAG: VanW family protein [Clostridia bacterium]|nr:VanW family protein [Clostridia bacterium]